MTERKSDTTFASSCTVTDTTILRKRLVKVIARRAGSDEAGAPMSGVTRHAYDELAVVLVPLVSREGFDALVGRAFDLARREYPAELPSGRGEAQETEPFFKVGLWVDQQDRRIAIEAAAAVFATLAGLLITLIGESLATRYLQKAWPEGFSAPRRKGRP